MNLLHRPTLLALAFAIASSLVLSSCNTTRGVGQDVEKAGESIQRAAK